MCDALNFQSSLSDDEMDRNFENVSVFEGLMDGLHEALAYEQGEVSVGTVIRKRSLSDKEELFMTTSVNPSAMDIEEIEMEEFDFSSDPSPEPPDTEWPPLLEELF